MATLLLLVLPLLRFGMEINMKKMKKYISMILLVLSLAFSLCCCDKESLPQEGEGKKDITENKRMQAKKKGSFYNSRYIFVTNKKGEIEQRSRYGKLICKIGFGRVCQVNEEWIYYVQQEKEKVILWRAGIQEKMKTEEREELCSVDGELTSRICVEEPYIIFAVAGRESIVLQYNMEQKRIIPCKIKYLYGVGDEEADICDIELENGCSYISISDEGIFRQDLDKGEREAKCIYKGLFSCQILRAYRDQMFFDHGNYTEPPLDAFSINRYSEKSGVLCEVTAEEIENVVKRVFKRAGNKDISDIRYHSVFGDFWLDDEILYIMTDEITLKEKGKKKSIIAVLSYDTLIGKESLSYEKEISDYMQKNKEADIVDIIQGSILIKDKDRACEFNISTKRIKRLKQSDINYWYVFGGHS